MVTWDAVNEFNLIVFTHSTFSHSHVKCTCTSQATVSVQAISPVALHSISSDTSDTTHELDTVEVGHSGWSQWVGASYD